MALTPASRYRLPRRGVLGLVALALLAAACTSHSTVDTSGAGNGTNFVTAGVGGGPISDPQPAPVLSGPTLTGARLSTAAYRGQVVVVNFWASWCAPCRSETPVLAGLARQFAGQGVRFVGVLFRDTADNGLAFAAADHVPYPSLYDPDGVDLLKFRGLNPTSIPDTVIINRQGRLAARYIGPITLETAAFTHEIAALAAGSPA